MGREGEKDEPESGWIMGLSADLGIAAALVCALIVALPSAIAAAGPAPGQPAPEFSGIDASGRPLSLADYRGSIVVLEWTNHECPFVRRHYDSGNMQALQKQAADDGVVWLTIISSAPGQQGYVTGTEANALTFSRHASPTAVILDSSGQIGRAYGAKTTPGMVVIDSAGLIVYMGAIDDQPRAAGADPARADNYVRAALNAIKTGQPVRTAVTQSYGCSIKYAN